MRAGVRSGWESTLPLGLTTPCDQDSCREAQVDGMFVLPHQGLWPGANGVCTFEGDCDILKNLAPIGVFITSQSGGSCEGAMHGSSPDSHDLVQPDSV